MLPLNLSTWRRTTSEVRRYVYVSCERGNAMRACLSRCVIVVRECNNALSVGGVCSSPLSAWFRGLRQPARSETACVWTVVVTAPLPAQHRQSTTPHTAMHRCAMSANPSTLHTAYVRVPCHHHSVRAYVYGALWLCAPPVCSLYSPRSVRAPL